MTTSTLNTTSSQTRSLPPDSIGNDAFEEDDFVNILTDHEKKQKRLLAAKLMILETFIGSQQEL